MQEMLEKPSLRWEDPLEEEMVTHSCLGSPMDRGAWWATVRGVPKSWIALSNFTFKDCLAKCLN